MTPPGRGPRAALAMALATLLSATACTSTSHPEATASVAPPTVAPSTASSGSPPPATGTTPVTPTRSTGHAGRSRPPGPALLPGMPAPLSPINVYAADAPGRLSPLVRSHRALIYVPNSADNTVSVVDQRTRKVIATFPVGHEPQHVVPSWDLKTLYVAADYTASRTGKGDGSLTPINPVTGRPGRRIRIDDPYNLYFTPDGRYGIVVAETRRRLDFYDPHTWKRRDSLNVSMCAGVDHLDYTADGRTLLASCEFAHRLIAVDVATHRLIRVIDLPGKPTDMPQDVKLSPDGRVFYVADMIANGVHIVDATTLKVVGFLPTGRGAHGLYIDRSATRLFVTNRDEGTISVIRLATRRVVARWRIPGGGSPDMGNLSADGKIFWVSGRYNKVVYAIRTTDGRLLAKIPVGAAPHGLCVWPQPGRYSLGHTGILR